MTGTLHVLGLGPGDPELLTLKAARRLRESPVIAFLQPTGGESLARRIAAPHLPGAQREIALAMPMDPDRAPGDAAYAAGAERVAAELDAGRDVALLCEGDPFLYGSALHLVARLGARFKVETVAGITSPAAAAARAGHPLAARTDAVAILPATLPDAELRRRIEAAEGVAILKLGRHFPRVRALLRAMGLEGDTLYAERVGQPGERIGPLAEAGKAAPYFALLLLYRGTEPAVRAARAHAARHRAETLA